MTKKGFFKKYEYVYDEYFDCYLCPTIKSFVIPPRTGKDTENTKAILPFVQTVLIYPNAQRVKTTRTVTRHIWEPYLEICEEIRHTVRMKEWYEKRKESIERIFGTAKSFMECGTPGTMAKLMEMKKSGLPLHV